jgi:hypothetical protein
MNQIVMHIGGDWLSYTLQNPKLLSVQEIKRQICEHINKHTQPYTSFRLRKIILNIDQKKYSIFRFENDRDILCFILHLFSKYIFKVYLKKIKNLCFSQHLHTITDKTRPYILGFTSEYMHACCSSNFVLKQ